MKCLRRTGRGRYGGAAGPANGGTAAHHVTTPIRLILADRKECRVNTRGLGHVRRFSSCPIHSVLSLLGFTQIFWVLLGCIEFYCFTELTGFQ